MCLLFQGYFCVGIFFTSLHSSTYSWFWFQTVTAASSPSLRHLPNRNQRCQGRLGSQLLYQDAPTAPSPISCWLESLETIEKSTYFFYRTTKNKKKNEYHPENSLIKKCSNWTYKKQDILLELKKTLEKYLKSKCWAWTEKSHTTWT